MDEYMNKHKDSIRLAKLEERVASLEEDAKEFHKILEPIRDETIRQDEHYKQILATLNEVKDDVKDLKNRPSKFLDYIYMTIISAVISFIITKFGG